MHGCNSHFSKNLETMSDCIANKGIPVLYSYCLGRTERPRGEKNSWLLCIRNRRVFVEPRHRPPHSNSFTEATSSGSPGLRSHSVSGEDICARLCCVCTSELFKSVNILSENRCQTTVPIKYLAVSSSTPNPSAMKDKRRRETERVKERKKEREGNFKISRGL